MSGTHWHRILLCVGCSGAFLAAFPGQAHAAAGSSVPPNIVLVLADDLGYGDPG